MDAAEIIRLYDAEVRTLAVSPAPQFEVRWDGPILRMVGPGPEAHANGVLYARLDESSADEAIARETAFFGNRAKSFEWKHFDYDRPADLGARLARAGFVAEDPETFVAYDIAADFPFRRASPQVAIRALDDPEEYGVIARVNEAVYGRPEHARWLAKTVANEKRAAPDAVFVYAAFAGDEPVAAGWLRHRHGDSFGSLWGGATLQAWRGKGLYSALVGARVAEAAQRGCRFLTVDCSPMSLPILTRCGFQKLAITTPFVWSPPPHAG